MNRRRKALHCFAILALTAGVAACSGGTFSYPLAPKQYGKGTAGQFTKVHTHDGNVFVTASALLAKSPDRFVGYGQLFDADREPRSPPETWHEIPIADVALVESNNLRTVPNDARYMFIGAGGVTGAMALYCAANPKACFGSCPTFYAGAKAQGAILAEGFSSSIARSLQEVDVDPLPGVRASDGRVTLTMTNEALESHAVAALDLIAVEGLAGGEIVRSGETFLALDDLRAPSRCRSEHAGDCTAAVWANDGDELHVRANASDLAHSHAIELTLPLPRGRAASRSAMDSLPCRTISSRSRSLLAVLTQCARMNSAACAMRRPGSPWPSPPSPT
ncbi:MAG: hypothetical protein FJ100_23435, partial [Deltaproteobacteria bacterium]|nr:hypothetical protein [Deltaproteobacteria bacterium]